MSTTWTIRNAVFEDLPRLVELDNELFPIEGGWSLEEFKADFNLPTVYYLVAVVDDEIIGYAASWIKEGVAEFFVNAVVPKYRGKGLGKEFLHKRMEWAGNYDIVLQTRTDNERIKNWYKKYGFVERQILKDYYSKGVDAVEMFRLGKAIEKELK